MKLKNTLAAACAMVIVAVAPAFAAKTLIKNNALASYYGAQFHGRPTSSGEMYDMYGMTAAHRTLPFGTMLEVTNLENGKSVVVRVNDRGPFVEGREIDVSLGAAEKLGMITSGVARVSIAIVDDADNGSRSLSQETSAPAITPVQPQPVVQSIASAQTQPIVQTIADIPVQIVQALATPAEESSPAVQPEPAPAPAAPVRPLTLLPPSPSEPASAPAPLTQEAVPSDQSAAALPAWTAPLQPAPEPVTPPAQPVASSEPVAPPEPVTPAEKVAPKPAPAAIEPTNAPVWRLQLGAFMREENAIRLVRQIRAVGIEPAYERTEDAIRVVIAGVKDADLESVKSTLEGAGLYDYIVRREK